MWLGQIGQMAIPDELTREPSFRRFYPRWLAACWSPALIVALPFAAVAIAFWLRFMPLFRTGFYFGRLALPLFWLLVALGQWWFMRRHSSSHLRWTATVVFAGFLASFVLFFASGLTFVPWTGILFPFLVAASTVTGPFEPTPWLMAAGGAGFGFVLAAALAGLVVSRLRLRLLWILTMTVAGGALFAVLWPLCDTLMRAWMWMRFPSQSSPLVVFGGMMGAPTGLLLAGWVLWSSAAGLALWHLRTMQTRHLLARTKQVFD